MSFFTHTSDFSQRDEAIRVNSYTTVRRRSSVPHEVFAGYWRDVHGPLCSRLPGLGYYVQHHFDRENARFWPLDELGSIPDYVLDGMVEIGFASKADQSVFQKASPILFSDEQNVFEETVAYKLPNGSKTYLDHLSEATPNQTDCVDRFHVHFQPIPGQQKACAQFITESLVQSLIKQEGVVKVRIHLPEPHSNETPEPPAPNVKHDVSANRTTLGMLEVAFHSPLDRRRWQDSASFQSLRKEAIASVAAVSAFAVRGVYTFVRDGKLTTAGLRGSRAAELIHRLGATNQISSEVEQLLKTGQL